MERKWRQSNPGLTLPEVTPFTASWHLSRPDSKALLPEDARWSVQGAAREENSHLRCTNPRL